MIQNPLRRPASLAEVAAESPNWSDFGHNLKDFLHVFAQARRAGQPLETLLAEEPVRLVGRFDHGEICDAFLAGAADYLARRHRIPTPAWALQESRVLEKPWFAEEFPQVRMRLLRDTPSAFKDKNVFVFESALSVA